MPPAEASAERQLQRPADRAAFNQLVYRIVRVIPAGRVMTYGSIGALIPPPVGTDAMGFERIRARWVGYALSNCPDDVPWHRVVNAAGRISLRHGLGPRLHRQLLLDEGVALDHRQRVQLASLQWRPSDQWLALRGLL